MGLPKILVGGVLIIDLMSLSLTPSVDMETYTPISNSEVLSQLLRLKQYIETPTAQKPLWVRMSYDGETITTMGALYKEDGDPHFKLIVKILDRRLIIDVTFTQDEETLEWYIDTEDAKYLFTSNSQEVDTYIADSISSGAIKDALDTKASLSGATFTGNVTAPKFIGDVAMESIKDSDGHSRFIEDNITPNEITGFTFTYSKWSLSGTHLLIVLAGTCEDNSSIPDNQIIAPIELPQWVLDKIYPVAGATIENKKVQFTRLDQTYTSVDKILTISKSDSTHLDIRNISGSQTITNASGFRFEFDLLIDNE